MAPAAQKRVTRGRQPLATTRVPSDLTQSIPSMVEIFNISQHVTNSDQALNQLKRLYKITPFEEFDKQFRDCVRKLFQSKQTIYFKTSCDFLCKFLQYLSKISDEIKTKDNSTLTVENTAPTTTRGGRRTTRASLASANSSMDASATTASATTTTTTTTTTKTTNTRQSRGAASKRGTKRKGDISDDELVMEFLPSTNNTSMQTDSNSEDDPLIMESSTVSKRRKSTASALSSGPVTNHDRIVSACIDVADMYMSYQDEECRLNSLFFICKFISHVDTLDEMICEALKESLPKRVRDKKPLIRAQAVLASRTFQDTKMTQDSFRHHFERDPELIVRKALLQIMDTKVFGYKFLVDSTQDNHESMRKAAFQRLGKVSPKDLKSEELHQVIHNGLNERERQASYSFKAHTLEPWLSALYDGLDLHKLLQSFDVLNYHDDICRLLEMIYLRDLEELQNNGTTTKLHHLVESFRDKWLNSENSCLPNLNSIDENVTTIWLTLVKFCKTNQSNIKSIKIRTLEPQAEDPNQSIERILDSQERRNDEVAELFERLTPDLVNLVDFLKRFVHHADQALKSKKANVNKLEFVYHHIMELISSYEIGDELERKTVQEVFGNLLKENLLTGKFNNFITPIIKCLYSLIYSSSSNLMINYISELINNVRSHLEDLVTTTQVVAPPRSALAHSTIMAPAMRAPRSAKKVRLDPATAIKRQSQMIEQNQQNIEFRIATIRVELAELDDQLQSCIKEKDFDGAKVINNKIGDLKAEYNMLHGRRCSMASDVSHMSMIIETEPHDQDKFSSTMIGNTSLNESSSSVATTICNNNINDNNNKDEIKLFKHHTNEMLKCLQMYIGCLQNVKITEVPQTMLNHLFHLNYECLDNWFDEDSRTRSLMVACNGITALVDKTFANLPTTMDLFITEMLHSKFIEVKTVAFKSLVDVVCQHDDIGVTMDKIEKFLNNCLSEYGKYDPHDMKKNEFDFASALIEGSTKLFYFKKLSSPDVLSHLILWWYHPKTHSKLKQFIGIFLPTFVGDLSQRQQRLATDDKWLEDLLEETFVCSIEYLYDYIRGRAYDSMSAGDMHSLINFLCNLVPISSHPNIMNKVDQRMDDLPNNQEDLLKFFKYAKNSLTISMKQANINNGQPTPNLGVAPLE